MPLENDEGEVRLDSLREGTEFACFLPSWPGENRIREQSWLFGKLIYHGFSSCLVEHVEQGKQVRTPWAPETPVFILESEESHGDSISTSSE